MVYRIMKDLRKPSGLQRKGCGERSRSHWSGGSILFTMAHEAELSVSILVCSNIAFEITACP